MRILAIALLLVLVCSMSAQAQWSGSQTIRFEPREDGLATVYTSMLQYSISRDRVLLLVVDRDPAGVDAEFSFTQYFRPWGDSLLYATFAVRKGVWQSELSWSPSVSFTYRF